MKVYAVILLCLLSVNQFEVKSNNEKPKTTLSVNIVTDDFSNGFVYVALHSKSDTFPKKGNEAPYMKRVKISGKKAKVIFTKIPYGTYAISAFYDENGNGKLDNNILVKSLINISCISRSGHATVIPEDIYISLKKMNE